MTAEDQLLLFKSIDPIWGSLDSNDLKMDNFAWRKLPNIEFNFEQSGYNMIRIQGIEFNGLGHFRWREYRYYIVSGRGVKI